MLRLVGATSLQTRITRESDGLRAGLVSGVERAGRGRSIYLVEYA